MKAQEIRERFTKYFQNYQHEKISSSALVPQNDPTLLFANAGMNQFKDYFTGKANPVNKRAVTIQKCVRAGGKHNDLDNVGFTARHHTFFEMLGNFSFGDYFKSEAIDFAWKFLTEELKIPKEKLYVTVHEGDDEAAKIWENEQGVSKDRIFRKGDKDNFWEMGDVGPCGPCSEIFFDHGAAHADGQKHKELLDDESRYVEIWNLVFMQFEKDANGTKPLPKPSVDTGAGLERLAAAMQGVYWNYDSDIFKPILDEIEKISGKKYSDKKYESDFRVVADHIRSSTMLITDGVIPSNEGRGYVLRSIIRRAIRHLNRLGLNEISFYKLVDCVFYNLGSEYPENMKNSSLAKKLLEVEEVKFRETLSNGEKLLTEHLQEIKSNKSNEFSADFAFKLYDTYGYPIELTRIICKENNLNFNEDKFNELMQKQKEASKKSSNFTATEDNLKLFYQLREKFGETKFTGYEQTSCKGKLLACEKVDDQFALVFDQTPFYAESGGQVADTGTIITTDGHIQIIDTQRPVDGLFVHFAKEIPKIELKQEYVLKVDSERRSLIARNHSATHLLQAALIKTLGDHIKQAGSLVTEDKLRFDFTHPEGLSKEQIKKIEDIVNQEIQFQDDVNVATMSKDQAIENGAMALFGEKYGDEVRTIKMGRYSFELCGGTHVKNTSEIGLFKIISEASLSSGIRRIEAVSSETARNYLEARSDILEKIEKNLSVKDSAVLSKFENLLQDNKSLSRELKQLKEKIQAFENKNLFSEQIPLANGMVFLSDTIKADNPRELRNITDNIINENNNAIVLAMLETDKLNFILRTNKANKELNLNIPIKKVISLINGKGGGRPDMIQGSGDLAAKDQFVAELIKVLKE